MSHINPVMLTREQVRRVDQLAIETYGMASLVLMENAARGCVDRLPPRAGPIAICCGQGNNGGDGFAIARHLDNAERPCTVFLFGREDGLTPDALANWRLLEFTDVERVTLSDGPTAEFENRVGRAEWTIDALLGTGVRGSIRSPFDRVIRSINERAANIAAVDIPTGLDANTGELLGPCIQANITWTFVGKKPGLTLASGPSHTGEIFTVDIGVPRRIIREAIGD